MTSFRVQFQLLSSGVINDRKKVIIGNYLGGTPHVNIWTGDRGQWTIGVIMGLTLS